MTMTNDERARRIWDKVFLAAFLRNQDPIENGLVDSRSCVNSSAELADAAMAGFWKHAPKVPIIVVEDELDELAAEILSEEAAPPTAPKRKASSKKVTAKKTRR